MNWQQWESEKREVPVWKIGLWPWRADGEWRLRLYRPWRSRYFIEVQSESLLAALRVLAVAIGWMNP